MKLQFHHHGKQFFFFTACLQGRPQVLSNLVEGEKRPLLTPTGEAVKAVLLGTHGRNPALTVSDYVIMPDHVHFLLIADYDRDPAFDPITFMHEWRQAAQRAGEGQPSPHPTRHHPAAGGAGAAALLAPRSLTQLPPAARGAGAAAPGHLASPPPPLSATPIAGGAGAAAPGPLAWERGYWIALAWYAEQRKAIRAYIRGNSARALWKRAHPDRFALHSRLRHEALDPALPWSAVGDLTLLASPFRFAVRLTRWREVAEQEAAIAEAVGRAKRGMIPVCGFLSKAERELQRRLRNEPTARWIKTVPHGLKPGYDPSLEDSRAIANGQLLILSSFPPDVPSDPILRPNCEAMNSRILALCGAAAEPIVSGQSGPKGRGGPALPAPHPAAPPSNTPPPGVRGRQPFATPPPHPATPHRQGCGGSRPFATPPPHPATPHRQGCGGGSPLPSSLHHNQHPTARGAGAAAPDPLD